MDKLPKDFEDVVNLIAEKLKGRQYAIRGTASLILQGIDMVALDIDVLADKKTALSSNNLLKKYLVDKVYYKESDRFKSYFGKFEIDKVDVEVYGDWQIRVEPARNASHSDAGGERESRRVKERWSEVFDASPNQVTRIKLKGKDIIVTTVETELNMFAKMGRWNAFHKIKREVEKKKQNSLF